MASPEGSDFVSAVICTRNRGASLVRTVTSLLASVHPNFELIVVDQSADDLTERALGPFMGDSRLRYIRTPTKGLSRARNIGIAEARSDIVVFTDDDCEVPPEWLSVVADGFQQDPAVAVVYSNVDADEHDRSAGFVPAFHGPTRLSTSLDGALLGIGAGMAVRKSLAQAIGGFDNALGPGAEFPSVDDRDIAFRALLFGYHVYHTNRAAVVHYGFRTWEEGRQLARRDCRGAGAVAAKLCKSGNRHLMVAPASILAHFLGLVVTESIRRRRLTGAVRVTAFIGGFVDGWRAPVDRKSWTFDLPA